MMLPIFFALQAPTATSTPVVNPKRDVKISFKMDANFVRTYDANHDGALSITEYQDAMTEKLEGTVSSDQAAKQKITADNIAEFRDGPVAAAFRSFDKNSDGELTADELKNMNTPG